MNGDLTCSCSESKSLQTKNITDIRFLEICIGIGSNGVSCHINLNVTL